MVTNLVGPPVRGEDFYGREADVALVSEKLRHGHVLLSAPRRFGKTSLMYNLMDSPKWDYQVVHADLEHLAQPAELISTLVVQLAKAEDKLLSKIATGLSFFPKKAWLAFARSFDEIELLKVKVKLKDGLKPRWQESGEELFNSLAKLDRTTIFFLDEFPMMIDVMARSQTHREEAKIMLRWLRALRLSPNIKNVRFLIAGSIGIGHVLNELGEISSINDFQEVRLAPFSTRTASGLITELARTGQVKISPRCRKVMLDLIGTPVPFFIQILFSEVTKEASREGSRVTSKLIERIYHDKVLGVDCKTYFDYYYGRLRAYYSDEGRTAKRILRELAAVGSLTRDACFQVFRFNRHIAADLDDDEHFRRLMTDLENDFYIRFESNRKRFEFSCKLLRDWWLRHYGLEATDGEAK